MTIWQPFPQQTSRLQLNADLTPAPGTAGYVDPPAVCHVCLLPGEALFDTCESVPVPQLLAFRELGNATIPHVGLDWVPDCYACGYGKTGLGDYKLIECTGTADDVFAKITYSYQASGGTWTGLRFWVGIFVGSGGTRREWYYMATVSSQNYWETHDSLTLDRITSWTLGDASEFTCFGSGGGSELVNNSVGCSGQFTLGDQMTLLKV